MTPPPPIWDADYYSRFPPAEGSHSPQVQLHPIFSTYGSPSLPAATSSSFLSAGQGGLSEREHDEQHKVDEQCSNSDQYSSLSGTSLLPFAAKGDEISNNAAATGGRDPSLGCPARWISSRMRFVRKMMNYDEIDDSRPKKMATHQEFQQQAIMFRGTKYSGRDESSSGTDCATNGTAPIRICSDCCTTRTPLWRSGPQGPKSLCNACGIRQRKARRAMAAAALADEVIPSVTPGKVPEDQRKQQGERSVPYKKRCKFILTDQQMGKEPHVDEFTICFGKDNPAFHRVFPQDEKEAAMLLMALSCGLIHG